MMHFFKTILILLCFFSTQYAFSQSNNTHRVQMIQNEKVTAWQTLIYPSKTQVLKPHRHDYDRVVVALTDGELKVINDKGKVSFLKFKKDTAYYLTKDELGELHSDENISSHAIKVIVIELKY